MQNGVSELFQGIKPGARTKTARQHFVWSLKFPSSVLEHCKHGPMQLNKCLHQYGKGISGREREIQMHPMCQQPLQSLPVAQDLKLCLETVNHHSHLKCQWKKEWFPRAHHCPDSFHQPSRVKDPEAAAKPPSIQAPVESSLVPDPAAWAINNISYRVTSRISGCQSSSKGRKNCLMHLTKCTVSTKCCV